MKRKVAFEIKRLDNMITRKICENVKKENIRNISHMQASILKFLYINKDKKIYQSDIEKEIDLRRSTVSGILKTMEKNGFIIRKDSMVDTRKKEVMLTDKSISKYKDLEKKLLSFEKKLLNGISLEEEKIFFEVIDKISSNLKEERKNYDKTIKRI